MVEDMDTKRIPPLWPREHGATAQLGLALGAGLVVNWPTPRALAQALLSLALFAASEPLLILLGKRGTEARRNGAPFALRRLLSLGLAAGILGLVAWRPAGAREFLSLMPVAGFAAVLFLLFLADHIHSMPGELAAALGMATAALPVALLGGTLPERAWALTACLAAAFSLGSLAVRGLLQRFKEGRTTIQRLTLILGGLMQLGALGLALRHQLPWTTALSPLPMLLLNLGLSLHPPKPGPLRALGWRLTAAALASTLLAVAGLR